MRWSDVYVSASAMVLGRKEDTAAAVADGRYDADFHAAQGYESVCVSGEDEVPVEMAVRAARSALERSQVDPGDVSLIVHASCSHQGTENPASYVQGMTIERPATAVEVKQACNGGMAAIELASAYLSASPGSAALVTTSDNDAFALPERNRYADLGAVAGDGAAAMVLSRERGVARLLSTAITGDGRFEHVTITDGLKGRSREAVIAEVRSRVAPRVEAVHVLTGRSIEAALADADVDAAQIARWVFQNAGHHMVDWTLRSRLGIEQSKTTWEWGRTVGHLSTSSQIAGLTYLFETNQLRAGDLVALCGGGVGFSVSCAVVEIVAEPDWTSSDED